MPSIYTLSHIMMAFVSRVYPPNDDLRVPYRSLVKDAIELDACAHAPAPPLDALRITHSDLLSPSYSLPIPFLPHPAP